MLLILAIQWLQEHNKQGWMERSFSLSLFTLITAENILDHMVLILM